MFAVSTFKVDKCVDAVIIVFSIYCTDLLGITSALPADKVKVSLREESPGGFSPKRM